MWGSSDSVSPVQPGDILADKYEVEQVLGVGGMGVVVAAKHVHLGGRVALKFLRPSAAESAEVVARFSREAQAATRIKSEHVARVIDVGKLESGSPYMVMEFLEGQDLGQLLMTQGPLPVGDAVDYLMQAMEAIAEAHKLGIVHRDLKPANLFMTRRADDSPLIKVLDFGIAKATDAAQPQHLTQTTGVMGSPLYMAPEQIRSTKHVDPRADTWSLGVILYELLAGRSPFDGESAGAVFAAILADPPPSLRAVRPDVPPELEAAIGRCLAKLPDERFPTIGHLAAALAPFGGKDSQVSATRITGLFSKGATGGPVVAITNPVGGTIPLADSGAVFNSQPQLAGSQPALQPANTRGAWGSSTGQPGATYSGQSGSNTGLVLGVGGGAAALLLIAAVVGGVMMSRRSTAAAAQPVATTEVVAPAPSPEPTPAVAPTVAPPEPSASAAPVASAEKDAPKSTATSTPTKTSKPTTTSAKPTTTSAKPTATGDDALGHR